MTQKEKLYFEYLTIKNSIYAVKGETDKQINLDEFCKKGRFWKEAKDSTVADLQRDIENAKRSLEQYKRDKKRDEWFATPEGAQWKQDKEAEIKHLYEQEQHLMDSALQYTSKVIQQLLGEQFDVTSFGSRCMTIGLVKEYAEDGRAKALFGHTFEVNFERDYFGDEKHRWELNYGTMGSFNLNEDNNTRTQYLVGLAKFASDKTTVPALRDYLHGYTDSLHTLSSACYDAQVELKNPSVLADNNE